MRIGIDIGGSHISSGIIEKKNGELFSKRDNGCKYFKYK